MKSYTISLIQKENTVSFQYIKDQCNRRKNFEILWKAEHKISNRQAEKKRVNLKPI
jgi:hypothetical protein